MKRSSFAKPFMTVSLFNVRVDLFTLDCNLWKRTLAVDGAVVSQRCVEHQSQ